MNPNNSFGSDLSSQIFPNRQTPPPTPPTPPMPTPPRPPMPSNVPPGIPPTPPPPRPPMTQPTPTPVPPPSPTAPQNTYNIPTSIPPTSSGSKKSLFVILIIAVVLIAGAGLGWAYFGGGSLFSKAPYQNDTLASDIFAGFSKIKTATYTYHLNVASQPKAADAAPFVQTEEQNPQLADYKKDLDTVRDVKTILQALQEYQYTGGRSGGYPASLSALTYRSGQSVPKSTGFVYKLNSAGTDFSLSVPFRSSLMISAVKKSTHSYDYDSKTYKDTVKIAGNTVTFSKASQYYLYVPTEPPQPFLINILSMQKYLSYIPADFLLDGSLTGTTVKTSDNKINSQLHLTGSANVGGVSFAVDAQGKKVGDNFYAMISKFPTVYYDISKIKEKWIMITPDDLASYGGGYIGSSVSTSQEDIAAAKEKAIQAVKIFLTTADKNKTLQMVTSPSSDTVNGIRAYKYELQFNKETMPEFYKQLSQAYSDYFKDKNPLAFDQATYDYMKSTSYNAAYDYFRKNTTLTLWATSDGIPVQLAFGLRMVPEATAKNADRQIMVTMTLTLSDVNKNVSIDAPKGAMTVEDAAIALTGQTKEAYEFSMQRTNISYLKSSLNSYKAVTGSYPNTLDDLLKTISGGKDNYTPRFKTVPKDAFTGASFDYTKVGSDYTLVYTMKWPPYTKGAAPLGNLYNYDYRSTPRIYSSTGRYPMVLVAVDGTNTATSLVDSKEAAAASKIDSDGDGLPDAFEKYIGTNPNKKDSDGDGHTDADEIQSSTNPLGPGNLTGSRYSY